MLKDKKILRIKHLMIFSQVLIAAFVIYWITERYRYEMNELRKDLTREFELSEQKMLDTMIRARMINPILHGNSISASKIALINAQNSKSVIKVTKTSNGDTTENDSIKFKFDIKFDSSNTDKQTDSIGNKSTLHIVRKNPKSERLLIEGVKVFMSFVNDSTYGETSTTTAFDEALDTSILKSNFSEKLLLQKLKPIWITKTDSDSLNIQKTKIILYSDMLNGKVGVGIENYTLFLLKKLAPNIFFGLLLLLTTGTAFIISFINLRKQHQLNKIRDEFFGNITHELKTPVATVKVALEALNKFNIKENPEKSSEYIKIASLELDRLDFLIQKVLTSSIYESSSTVANFENVNLDDILSDVIKTMQIRFESENATVTKESIGTDFNIFADRVHIQGVIINLLDNSLKYTNGNPTIHINLISLEKTIILSVSDSGIGIPEEYHGRIFEKFFRVPSNNKHNVKGHGLGLNYVGMVMKQHNGTISVKNNPTRGCTFTLRFPKTKGQ
ncbi:MAG: HAMP domain-containing histidine kinase [Bacteroidales bacterium]|nr:MAG: HAMP domain-containing histidine kinase [Bacteroidales bacterium]